MLSVILQYDDITQLIIQLFQRCSKLLQCFIVTDFILHITAVFKRFVQLIGYMTGAEIVIQCISGDRVDPCGNRGFCFIEGLGFAKQFHKYIAAKILCQVTIVGLEIEIPRYFRLVFQKDAIDLKL